MLHRGQGGRSTSLLKQTVPDNLPFTDDDIPQLNFRQARSSSLTRVLDRMNSSRYIGSVNGHGDASMSRYVSCSSLYRGFYTIRVHQVQVLCTISECGMDCLRSQLVSLPGLFPGAQTSAVRFFIVLQRLAAPLLCTRTMLCRSRCISMIKRAAWMSFCWDKRYLFLNIEYQGLASWILPPG